ncbi:RalA-binding protein 1 [Holothuria leucospilota]|uniref:RalA-binding protein 1 n=1 Tax=Holothuria leucospilota TaxID=206669 RepID=A0A9Q1H8G9_HOLLE|nr:RalA-binding protein 1 [Holothuria leucospilota]
MTTERSGNGKYRQKNPSLQDSDGKKKWSSKTELSSRSSSTLEHPKKNFKNVESVSDDEEERNKLKKKKRLFTFSTKSKKDKDGGGDLKKRSRSREGDLNKESSSKPQKSRSNTISELSVSQLQKRRSREIKPIFKMPLAEAVKQSKSLDGIELPLVVRECIDHAEEFGLTTPGIYRISGIKSKIEQLKTLYNEGRSVNLTDYDVTVVTGLLKLYLRDLPEPVLTSELMPKFEEAAAVPNDQLRLEEFQAALKELPSCNYTLLAWIIVHLIHVLDNADQNRMSVQNLSIVFSPTMQISHRVLYHFFTNWEAFFGHVRIKKCRKPLQLDQAGQVELPDSVPELEEYLHYHEMILNKMHEDLNKGVASHGTEEELWEVQRIVTQIKRKLRKAKSLIRQAAKKKEEDEANDSTDQKSTDSKLEDESSTGTDENKLEENEKDVKEDSGPIDDVKPEAVSEEDTSKSEAVKDEEEAVSPEEVKVEIKEDDGDEGDKEEEEKQLEEKQKQDEDEEEQEEEEEEEEEEESLESLYLYYSELIAKQEEFVNIRMELQRRIEMEKQEVARLQAEIEAAKVASVARQSTSSSQDLSDNSSSDSEDEEELQEILKKLLEENERLKRDNRKSSAQIPRLREEFADLKAKISVEERRSEIISDLQDELEKDKAKKEKKGNKKVEKLSKETTDEKTVKVGLSGGADGDIGLEDSEC